MKEENNMTEPQLSEITNNREFSGSKGAKIYWLKEMDNNTTYIKKTENTTRKI